MPKQVLIISPYFPPDHTPDMHRIRMGLQYFRENGWEPIILAVDPLDSEASKDPYLLDTLPDNIKIIRVRIPSPNLTRKIGLGSIAIRALWPFFWQGIKLIRENKINLIYFSTTQFPIMILGKFWKLLFNIPYLLDFQDPWHSDHYLKLPPDQRPPKFWFSYHLNKWLEPLAVNSADGLIAVTQPYLDTFNQRYPKTKNIPLAVIPFGASPADFESLKPTLLPDYFPAIPYKGSIRIIYTGVVNQEMQPVIRWFLQALSTLNQDALKSPEVWFIGTNYATGNAIKLKVKILEEAQNMGDHLIEITNRVPYLTAIQLQLHSDILLLCGTTDANYIASKLAPYLISKKPILAILHYQSSAVKYLAQESAARVITFDPQKVTTDLIVQIQKAYIELTQFVGTPIPCAHPELWSAQYLTQKQTQLMDLILNKHKETNT
ncbi:MAG: hypothetical protein EBS07_06585 [Sphingobacteriia bacterium]|nr:hypothetical protein [Sphingobacteriia bacterium]